MRLTPANVDQLRAEAGISPQPLTNALAEEISREDPCPFLDPRLLLAIDQRRVEADLYADLEACADLFGREPIFSLEIPSLRSPEFIQRCIDSWQVDRQDRVHWRQEELALVERLHGLEQRSSNAERERDLNREDADLKCRQLLQTREELEKCSEELREARENVKTLEVEGSRCLQECAHLRELQTSLEGQLFQSEEQLRQKNEKIHNLELELSSLLERCETTTRAAELNVHLLHQTQEELELSFLECQEGKRHAENTQRLVQAQQAELGRAIKVLQLLASMKGLSDETPPTSIQMLAILEGYRHSLKRAERLLASN